MTRAASQEAKGWIGDGVKVCGANEQHTMQKSRADLCPVGGDSPVITTIGYRDSAQRSLQPPCLGLQMTVESHATGPTVSSGQREQGMHALGDVDMLASFG